MDVLYVSTGALCFVIPQVCVAVVEVAVIQVVVVVEAVIVVAVFPVLETHFCAHVKQVVVVLEFMMVAVPLFPFPAMEANLCPIVK